MWSCLRRGSECALEQFADQVEVVELRVSPLGDGPRETKRTVGVVFEPALGVE